MKKVFGQLTAYLLAFVFIFCIKTQIVEAGELNSTFTVKFSVVDVTGKYPGNSFNVHIEDITGASSQDFVVDKSASWGNNSGNVPSTIVAAPTTYNISVSGLEEGYRLMNFTSESAIETSFAASNNGEKIFSWAIIEDDGSALPSADGAANISEAGGNTVVDNAEAEAVYAEFLEATAIIKDDPAWAGFLSGYDMKINSRRNGEMYAATVNNGSKTVEEMQAEYEAFSQYDKFVYYATYLYMAYAIHEGHSEEVSSYDSIKLNYQPVLNGMQGRHYPNEEEVVAAYEKLLHWQADYIAANGSPFNFITNRSYLEEMGIAQAPEIETKDEMSEKSKKEIEQARKEIEKIENQDKGIWDDTLDSLSSNLITIVILIILLGALGVVIYIKKKNNITEEIHEK